MTTTSAPPAAADPLRAVLAAGTRPPRPGAISASLAHCWRVLRKMKHNAVPAFAEVTFMPIVSLLLITYLFGGAFAGSTSEYLHYFLPGVLVQTVTLITVWTGTIICLDITKGIFDRFRTMPFWQPATIVGNMLSDIVRYVLAMAVTVAVGLLLGFRPDAGVTGVVLTMLLLVLFAFSASWIFAALGLVVKAPESISGMSMLVLFPLVFASNIFVRTETMPGWLQAIINLNPVSHASTAARGLMHGTATGRQVGIVVAISVGLVAVFAPLTMHLYRTKNRH